MNRPAALPGKLVEAIVRTSDSYAGRNRMNRAFQGWANRAGPVTKCPSAAVTRDIREVSEFPGRELVAEVVDHLMTTAVLVSSPEVEAEKIEGLPSIDDILVRLARILTFNAWHP